MTRMIKCLLAEFRSGRTGNDLALGPYAMTPGQVFPRPALPLSQ